MAAPSIAQARWYDPERGRFISHDPLGRKASMNLYNFTKSDPVNFVDSTGLFEHKGPFAGKCCNNTDQPIPVLQEHVYVWLSPGQCLPGDCDGMWCNGTFYSVEWYDELRCDNFPRWRRFLISEVSLMKNKINMALVCGYSASVATIAMIVAYYLDVERLASIVCLDKDLVENYSAVLFMFFGTISIAFTYIQIVVNRENRVDTLKALLLKLAGCMVAPFAAITICDLSRGEGLAIPMFVLVSLPGALMMHAFYCLYGNISYVIIPMIWSGIVIIIGQFVSDIFIIINSIALFVMSAFYIVKVVGNRNVAHS